MYKMLSKPTYEELEKRVEELEKESLKRKRLEGYIENLNLLKERLLDQGSLSDKLKRITNGVVEIFDADFARIWIIKKGDLCDYGCFHADVTEGPHVCRYREQCLHLMASSGRYTHTDGSHKRVPFGCYKIGRVASGEEPRFLTNDAINDPRIHDKEWARRLNLVAFAGYQLLSVEGKLIGVLALFSKKAINPDEDALLESTANTTAQVIQTGIAEEALWKSEERYRLLFENANDAIFIIQDGMVKFPNSRTEVVTGYSKEELSKIPFRNLIHPEDRDMVLKRRWERLMGEKPPSIYSFRIINRSGDKRWVQINTALIPWEGNPATINFIRDITERKHAEENLKKAHDELAVNLESIKALETQKSKFMRQSAHQLKSPLATVIASLNVLTQKMIALDSERAFNLLDGCNNKAKSLLKLVNSLLEHSRIMEGIKTIQKDQEVDLVWLIEKIISSLKELVSASSIEILRTYSIYGEKYEYSNDFQHDTDIEEHFHELPTVIIKNCNEEYLEHGFYNIIHNAIKYSQEGKIYIDLLFSDRKPGAIFSIKDEGIGIEPEYIDDIFLEFVRSPNARDHGLDGSGLGLVIVKEVFDEHGAKISVESDINKGTTFTVTFNSSNTPLKYVLG
jgi:PAS domain S-box-containing protein